MLAVASISVESQAPYKEYPFFRDPRFRRFLKQFGGPFPEHQNTSRHRSMGSGFVFDSGRCYVLTNRHVIRNARSITVTLKSRHNHRAQLVGSDSQADIAVLRISPVPLRAQGPAIQRLERSGGRRFRAGHWQSLRYRSNGYVRHRECIGVPGGLQRRQQWSHTDQCFHQPRPSGPLVDLRG